MNAFFCAAIAANSLQESA